MRTRQNEGRFSGINTDEVFILEGGLNEWKKAGCVIAKNNKTPLPIMRQVQIAAGTLIVLGAILSYLVSSWFVLVSGFVGVGLIIAGLTGFCGMANLLMMLPYNKNNGCNTGCK
jgi:rhodanese-related sulfurtransferase